MKIAMSMLLALTLSVAVMARQQDNQTKPSDQGQSSASQSQSSPNQTQNNTDQNQATSTQNQNTRMSGKVSKNGKNFTNDANSQTYGVNNPDALAGHEGQHVVVLVHVDPDTGTIHITQLEPPQ
jgi:hypothetical protein